MISILRERSVDRLRRYGPTVLGSLASQAFSVLAIAATVSLGLDTSDAYSIGMQIGNTALTTIVLSVLYLAVIGRPSFRAWGAASAATFSVSMILGLIVVFAVSSAASSSNAEESHYGIHLIFAAGGAALALAGVHGVRLACHGRPFLLSLVTVIPNAALLLGVLTTRVLSGGDGNASLVLPAVCWALGACVAAAIYWVLATRLPHVAAIPQFNESLKSKSLHVSALAWSAGNIGLASVVLLASTSQLDPGTTTALFLISRAGTSIVTTGVNAILAVRYNWVSAANVPAHRVSRTLWLLVGLLAVTIGVILVGGESGVALFPIAILWLYAIVVTPIASREANARRRGGRLIAKAALETIVGGFAVLWVYLNPTPSGFFAAWTVISLAGLAALTWRARDRSLAVMALLPLPMAVACLLLAT
ncbi:hypothetical protein [Blastococcus haudaquaticus]|uniref:Membrane protein involved in the export of O-antigen and teichoic acid n=1 Tax=Blastococcus haudaquaticus TaxID=1938745 RepID=A0A286GYT0_9ACTN|nr:hypothetical protein [Blastococcus haudaquaticus]SOE00366.1 hypothetical protein SAMN06272739_2556 [Blastococcus haudaquaticus]